MVHLRIKYFAFTCITILLGLISRQLDWIPLFTGDALYAVMIFFMMRTLIPNVRIYQTSVIALVITYSVEFSQLYRAEWINNIRRTLLGRLVLGQGFLWSDVLAYLIGILLATFITKQIIERKTL